MSERMVEWASVRAAILRAADACERVGAADTANNVRLDLEASASPGARVVYLARVAKHLATFSDAEPAVRALLDAIIELARTNEEGAAG